MFFQECFNPDIIWVRQLFDSRGVLFSYQEFLQHYQTPETPKQFAVVFHAAPSGVSTLFKNCISASVLDAPLIDVTESAVGKVCFNPSGWKNNRRIRALFQCHVVPTSPGISYWNCRVNNWCWEKIWTLPQKFFVVNKAKEVSFRIIHRCYAVRCFFVKFHDEPDLNCAFCDSHTESVVHLFWKCTQTRKLWQDICRFILDNIFRDSEPILQNVLFGLS